LAAHSGHFFPPTLAILGGLLAQDILRALSRKDRPISNLLVIDSFESLSAMSPWNMGPDIDAE